jgi:hypothetical protein
LAESGAGGEAQKMDPLVMRWIFTSDLAKRLQASLRANWEAAT